VKLFAAMVASLVLPVAAAELRIELRPRVALAGGPLLLGQLARLESDDLQLLRTVVDLPVGLAPRAGHSRRVSAASLQAAIQGIAARTGSRVQWAGAPACDVEAATTLVTGESIARAAAQSMGGQAQATRLPRDLRIPAGPVTLTARFPGQPLAAGRQLVWVDVRSGGEWVQAVAVPVRTQAEVARRTATGPERAGRARPESVAVRPVPAVGRGQSATLRSGWGDVMAETRVEVLQDGNDGDHVLVRSGSAPAPLSARVVGPALLEVDR
jgi:hypothetical protein